MLTPDEPSLGLGRREGELERRVERGAHLLDERRVGGEAGARAVEHALRRLAPAEAKVDDVVRELARRVRVRVVVVQRVRACVCGSVCVSGQGESYTALVVRRVRARHGRVAAQREVVAAQRDWQPAAVTPPVSMYCY